MLHSDDRLTASQQALLDAAHEIGLRTLDGASRLLELNLRTARATLAQTATRLKDAFEPLGDGDAGTIASRVSTPVVEQAAAYTRDACEIIAATHAEIVSVLGRKAPISPIGAWFLVTPSMAAATRAASMGSDMTETVEQIAHAVDVVVHAAEPGEPVAPAASADVSVTASNLAPIPVVATPEPVRAPEPGRDAAESAQPAAAEDSAPAESTATEPATPEAVEAPAPMIELPLGDEPPAAPKAQQPIAQAVHQAIEKAVRPAAGRKVPAVARAAATPAEPAVAKPAQPAARAGGRAASRRPSTSS